MAAMIERRNVARTPKQDARVGGGQVSLVQPWRALAPKMNSTSISIQTSASSIKIES